MCLITKNTEGCVSDRPKTCYKVYMRGDDGKLVSYYVGTRYDLKEGDEIVAEGKGDIVRHGVILNAWTLREGFIHAYQRYETAVSKAMFNIKAGLLYAFESALRLEDFNSADRILDEFIRELNESYVICKMEIPAGETYWEGNHKDICSRRLIFKEEIRFTEEILLNTLYAWSSGCSYTVICEYLRHKKK